MVVYKSKIIIKGVVVTSRYIDPRIARVLNAANDLADGHSGRRTQMRIYKRKGSSNWWPTWRDQDGRRYRRSTGTANRKEGEALIAVWVKDIFMEKNFGKTPDVPFGEALSRYAKVQKRDHSTSFYNSTRYRLKYLQEWFGDFNVADIALVDIEDFMNERLDTGVGIQTVYKDVSTLRAILNKAHREDLLSKMPKFPKLKKFKPRTRWINQAEEEALVANAAKHLVPIIRFAVDTGGRRGELLGLNWKDVDLKNRRIVFVDTKNGDDRPINLCKRAYATLLNLNPKPFGPVFTFNGKAMKSVKTSFDNAREKAGLEDVRFHDLRHTFASRLVQGGIPLYDVMHMTGHKSLDMVQRYAHLAPDHQKDSIRVLDNYGHTLVTVDNSREVAA